MSIPRRFPIVETGDSGDVFSAWRVKGLTDENSDRGALYPSSVDDPLGIRILVYSDYERTELVAEGAGALGSRVTAVEVADSGLEVSVMIAAGASPATNNVVLWVQLATLADISEREDDARAFFTEDPPERNFDVVALATMRQFYLNVQALFPPPQREVDPLALRAEREQIAGGSGRPDSDGPDLWALNGEGDWELVGLQNVSDWKEWAILWSLSILWKRKAGSAEDPMRERAAGYADDAAEAWAIVPVLVDKLRDRTPSRQVRRRAPLIRRG